MLSFLSSGSSHFVGILQQDFAFHRPIRNGELCVFRLAGESGN